MEARTIAGAATVANPAKRKCLRSIVNCQAFDYAADYFSFLQILEASAAKKRAGLSIMGKKIGALPGNALPNRPESR
jgi:hypothetical protein